MSLDTISTPGPRGEPEGGDPESLLLSRLSERNTREDNTCLCSERTGEEDEGDEEGGDMEATALRFSRGGTGGSDPRVSHRERLRLGRVLPGCLCLWLWSGVGVASDPMLFSAGGVSSDTVRQMDSWDRHCGGGAGSGNGQKLMGTVLLRLKTVLGLGTGFTGRLLLSESCDMEDRSGVELLLNPAELRVAVALQPDSDMD